MITISRKSLCAIEAVLYIASQGGAEPVSSKAVCEYLGVAPRHLEQMMQKLVHAGILRGMRGPRGGYLLARERRRITLEEIRHVLQEEDLSGFSSSPTDNSEKSALLNIAETIENTITEQLSTITLADLCAREDRQTATAMPAEKRMDFTI